MPRLSPSTLLRAKSVCSLLTLLLKQCRTIPSALTELRWMKKHLELEHPGPPFPTLQLLQMCEKRSRGVPLQYLLKSQPFGHLDILCRPGVLIPRPETEAYTTHLAKMLTAPHDAGHWNNKQPRSFRILDLCTGTGCIPLLLDSLLKDFMNPPHLIGVDISKRAVDLARSNVLHNLQKLASDAETRIMFQQADIFSPQWRRSIECWEVESLEADLVISNPPYISDTAYWTETSRSVRNYEPKISLVPRPVTNAAVLPEDVFYPEILRTAATTKAKVVLMEVGDMHQALRVAQMALELGEWTTVEIWRDWPDGRAAVDEVQEVEVRSARVAVRGTGHGRSVIGWA